MTRAPALCDTRGVTLRFAAALVLAASLAACSTTLERGLDEPQADEIVVALGERGIGATKEPERGGEGFDVVVLESDVARALGVLRDEGLPRTDPPGTAEAYAEPSLVPTAGQERARMAAALGADLARAIETMPGVHDARVQIGLADPSVVPLDETPPASSASVLLHVEEGASVDDDGVRALVAGAVPGLTPERVALVRSPMRAPHVPAEPLVSVGPIYVTQGSAFALRAVLAALLGVNVLLAAAVGVVVRRRR